MCTFDDIVAVFKDLTSQAGVENRLSNDDYSKDWMFLRYWGQGKGEFKSQYDYRTVIQRYLSEYQASSVLIKGDQRVKSISTDQLVEYLSGGFDVEKLEGKFIFNSDSVEDKDNFFAETLLPDNIKGNVHVFDSSLSIYVAINTEAKLCFPNDELILDVFEDHSFASAVIKYSNLYKSVCDYISMLKVKKQFSGCDFFVVTNKGKDFSVSEVMTNRSLTISDVTENLICA